jgi:hypothetical protein
MEVNGSFPMFDWKMKVCYSKSQSYFVIGVDTDVAPMSWLLDVGGTAIAALRPSYGIGYTRELRRGPTLYAVGVSSNTPFSGPEYEDAVRTTAWGLSAMTTEVYRNGILRDVHPYNFLTAPQLKRRVRGISLEAWISQDADRGLLTELSPGCIQWSVVPSETSGIREVLQQEGAIFSQAMQKPIELRNK